MTHKSGIAAMSVVMYVVTPSIRLDGMKARMIQLIRRPQVGASIQRLTLTSSVSSLGGAGRSFFLSLPVLMAVLGAGLIAVSGWGAPSVAGTGDRHMR